MGDPPKINTPAPTIPTKRVSADDVLAAAGAGSSSAVQGITGTQRLGFKLASGVGVLAAAVMLGIGIAWWHAFPGNPDVSMLKPGAGNSSSQISEYISNYKALASVARDSLSGTFEAVVVKVLLPVFTSILGYIFGTHREGQGG